MKKLIVICDSECEYSRRLGKFFRNQKECDIEIKVFSNEEMFLSDPDERDIDVLLISNEVFECILDNELSSKRRINKTYILINDEYSQDAFIEETIYKYQSALAIFNRILQRDKQVIKRHNTDDRVGELIGVYSPVKRNLKTTFSYVFAGVASETENTVFISLEGCSGLKNVLSFEKKNGLADLLFDYSVHPEEYPEKINNYINYCEGISVISPVECISEIQCVDTELIVSIITCIKQSGFFNKIILDIGDNVNGIIDILRCCDRIYMPYRDDYMSLAKMKSFDSSLLIYDEPELIISKIQKLDFSEFEDVGDCFSETVRGIFGEYVRGIVNSVA